MNQISIITLLDVLTLFQLYLLSITLFLTHKGRKTSNRILAAFLIIQSQCVLNSLQWRYFDWSFTHIPGLFFLTISPLMLLGAGLYFYTKSMTEPRFVFRKRDWLHTVPFFLHFGFYFIRFHRFSIEIKQELLKSGSFISITESRIMDNLFFILLISYMIVIVFMLKRYHQRIQQVTSNQKSGLRWLLLMILGFIFLWFTDVTEYYLFWFKGVHTFMVNVPHPAIFILATIMVWRTMMQSDTFQELSLLEKEKYPISPALRQTYLSKLKHTMESEKIYLNPDLTLSGLSTITSIPPRHLSEIINENMKQNFYDFVNQYRILESKRLLLDNSKTNWSILAILYEAGFNSKTTFNTTFKKQTGLTPTLYRKQMAENLSK